MKPPTKSFRFRRLLPLLLRSTLCGEGIARTTEVERFEKIVRSAAATLCTPAVRHAPLLLRFTPAPADDAKVVTLFRELLTTALAHQGCEPMLRRTPADQIALPYWQLEDTHMHTSNGLVSPVRILDAQSGTIETITQTFIPLDISHFLKLKDRFQTRP